MSQRRVATVEYNELISTAADAAAIFDPISVG
jgi:hypothetical protein